MPSPKKLIASTAIAAGLLGGGVVGVVLGVPGVSGAQTTTVPDAPTTTVPGSDESIPDRPARGDRENCPEKDGAEGTAPSGGGTGTNLNLRRSAGGRV
jgi:hypothetical protein